MGKRQADRGYQKGWSLSQWWRKVNPVVVRVLLLGFRYIIGRVYIQSM